MGCRRHYDRTVGYSSLLDAVAAAAAAAAAAAVAVAEEAGNRDRLPIQERVERRSCCYYRCDISKRSILRRNGMLTRVVIKCKYIMKSELLTQPTRYC